MISRSVDGIVASEAEGGSFPEAKPFTRVKNEKEVRGLFGVAMIKTAEGKIKGVKSQPFQYTGKTVVGIKTFEKHKNFEYYRVLSLGGQWGKEGEGYKERYEGNWEVELIESVNKSYICITDLMDHVVSES